MAHRKEENHKLVGSSVANEPVRRFVPGLNMYLACRPKEPVPLLLNDAETNGKTRR